MTQLPISQFGDLRTTQKTPLIELNSAFGLSSLRDIQTTAGSATITNSGGEHRLQLTASGTDDAILDSAERGRYKPGYSAECGLGIRIPVAPAGNQVIKWGYSDGVNGAYFGYDARGLFVARLSNSVETKVYQSGWNVDNANTLADVPGETGLIIDPARGNIFQIVFSWYGYGVISFQTLLTDSQGVQKVVVLHNMTTSQSVSIQNPNLPIRVQASNASTATALDVYVGGRQFAIIGRYIPNERSTGARRILLGSIGTTALPLVSIRRKAGFLQIPVRIANVDAIVTGDALLEVYLNASLTGASYATPENVTAAETAIERDITATALSGGTVIWSSLIGASGAGASRAGSSDASGLAIGIPAQQPVTLAVRALTGTVTASGLLLTTEDW